MIYEVGMVMALSWSGEKRTETDNYYVVGAMVQLSIVLWYTKIDHCVDASGS